MRISKTTACWNLLLLLAIPCSVGAQAKSAQDTHKSAGEFVQQFYDWYVPRALKHNAGPASDLALKYKDRVFSPKLFRALKEDSDAQANVNGPIVGLDFDPFLASQDPAERYEVGKATRKGGSYWVDVYGIWSGKKSEKADVVAEVARTDGRWLFVNFYYPNAASPRSGDLLSVLALLQEDRQKYAK